MIKTAIRAASLLVMVGASLFLGYLCGQSTFEPRVVIVNEVREVFVPVEVIKVEIEYISYPVQVPIEVEVAVFREPTDWNSIEELEAFLEQDNTDGSIRLKAGSDGVVRFNNQCEDFALQLRDRAMAQGKFLSVVVIELEDNRYHALCMARIGNEFWYVEPQTDECWLGLYLD